MAEEQVERRLAAILAADVVGYSRLMGEDEVRTLEGLKSCRRELIDPTIKEYHGRMIKLMGDGALVEFASVVDAIQCAATIQRRMVDRNNGAAEALHLRFRIGINLGDVIVEGDDIYGEDRLRSATLLLDCGQVGVVRIDNEYGKHARGFRLAGILLEGVVITRKLRKVLAGAICLHRTVVDLGIDCSLEHRGIDESRFCVRVRPGTFARPIFDEHALDALAWHVGQRLIVDQRGRQSAV